MILQSHWFLPLLGNKSKKFDFVHQTISCRRHVQAGHNSKKFLPFLPSVSNVQPPLSQPPRPHEATSTK